MAPVNPNIQPTNDPSYGANSRPVDVPETIRVRGVEDNRILPEGVKQGDRSAEYTGQAKAYGMQADAVGVKGFGDLFAGIAQAGDLAGKMGVELVKKDIEDRVYTTASEIRQAYTDKLEELRQNPGGLKNVLDATNGGETPDELSSLGDSLVALRGAKDAGKISNTYYQGRLLAEAKDLRARYPGFRQEIDAEFAKVTGSNPANAYVQSLVQDINKAASAAGSSRNKIETFIRSNIGFPGAEKVYQAFQSGQMSEQEVIQWAAPYEQQKVQLQNRAAKFNDVKLSREEQSYHASKAVDEAIGTVVNRTMDSILVELGITDEASAVRASERLKTDPVYQKQWEAVGQRIANIDLKLRSEMVASSDRSGATKLLQGGKEELNKRIDAGMENIKRGIDRVYSRDVGTLFSSARSTKEMTDNDTRDLFADSKVGPEFRQTAVMKQFGESFMANYALKQLQSDLPKQYAQYTNRWKAALITQAEYGPRGTPVTLNNAFDEFRDKKVVDPKVSASVINEVSRIGDKETPDDAKMNLALAAFSPGNRGFISRLNADGVDSRGRQIQGQNAVFQKFTTPEITREMARLGKDNPQVWDNYVNWTRETFGRELLSKEINNLSEIGSNPNIKLGWDDVNKKIKIEYQNNFREGMTSREGLGSGVANTDPAYNRAVVSINRINSNLVNFKNVAEASGQDVDAFLLRSIRDLNPRSLDNVQGIPAQMIQQIDLTRSFGSRFQGKKN